MHVRPKSGKYMQIIVPLDARNCAYFTAAHEVCGISHERKYTNAHRTNLYWNLSGRVTGSSDSASHSPFIQFQIKTTNKENKWPVPDKIQLYVSVQLVFVRIQIKNMGIPLFNWNLHGTILRVYGGQMEQIRNANFQSHNVRNCKFVRYALTATTETTILSSPHLEAPLISHFSCRY